MQSRMVSLQGVKCFCGGNEEVGVRAELWGW